MLQTMKIKDKSSIPAYLHYRDKEYMYFSDSKLVLFLHNIDSTLKEVVNDSKHGDTTVYFMFSTICFVLN